MDRHFGTQYRFYIFFPPRRKGQKALSWANIFGPICGSLSNFGPVTLRKSPYRKRLITERRADTPRAPSGPINRRSSGCALAQRAPGAPSPLGELPRPAWQRRTALPGLSSFRSPQRARPAQHLYFRFEGPVDGARIHYDQRDAQNILVFSS